MSAPQVGNGPLGNLLREIKASHKIGLGDLTVLSPQNDPFRLDTEANHEAGRWFRDQMQASGLLARATPIHNRGVHYAIVGDAKFPSGKPYTNDEKGWAFLEAASKAARWLGYVPFEKIVDARNAEPIVRTAERPSPRVRMRVEAALYLPDADDLAPRIEAEGFTQVQPYRLVFFGEKTSLEDVLAPLADQFGADLYLPAGEISDTMLARMARTGAADQREMVVLVLADCDPAGYQMAVSIAHKLRAFHESLYPALRFRVLAPALTVEQVKELGLPSTPLKETEKRADGWRKKHGVEQTEIDALATRQPDVLRRIVRDAVAPYFDSGLAERVRAAKSAWEVEAQEALQANTFELAGIQAAAEADLRALQHKLHEMEAIVDDLDLDLPPIVLPEPCLDDSATAPLVDSAMPLLDAIRALRARKTYGDEPAAEVEVRCRSLLETRELTS